MEWPIITKDTSIEEIHRIHKAIWQYVVDNGEKPDTPYAHDCVLCEYDDVLNPYGEACMGCPAIWKNKRCHDLGSEYEAWHSSYKNPHLNELAQKVRDIPFKYEKENNND